jgi:hypothetical protein
MDRYIRIPGWSKYQHGDATKRGNNPKWIKLYTALHSDDRYLSLTGPQRAALHGIWIEYARSGREILDNTARLSRRINMRVSRHTLTVLNHAGFIEFCHDTVTPRGEEIREEQTRRLAVEHGDGSLLVASEQATSSVAGYSPASSDTSAPAKAGQGSTVWCRCGREFTGRDADDALDKYAAHAPVCGEHPTWAPLYRSGVEA